MLGLYKKEKREQLRTTNEFKRSNKIWNDLKLNSGFAIGYLMKLIDEGECKTLREWSEYYFNSGKKRLELISSLPDDIQYKLNNLDSSVKTLYYEYNTNYGRTQNELITIAKELDKHIKVGLEIAYNFVYIRIIDETWLGYMRECKSLETINRHLIKYGLHADKATYYTDIHYAVDFEIKSQDNEVLYGIQLKSTKYLLSKNKEIKKINKRKNKLYESLFNAPVFYLYVDKNNYIINLDELHKIMKNHIKHEQELLCLC